MKKYKISFFGMFAMRLLLFVSCQTSGQEVSNQTTTTALASEALDSLLRSARSETQIWGDRGTENERNMTVYSFNSEITLDELIQAVNTAGYYQTWSGEYSRDWDLQRGVLRWCVSPNHERWDNEIQYSVAREATVQTLGFKPHPYPDVYWMLVSQSEITDYMESVAYGNGKFIAVGRPGSGQPTKMAYSIDGITWTAVAGVFDDIENGIDSITFCGGKFFALGYRGAKFSTDGIIWTRMEASIFNRQDIRGPVYGDGKFVVATYSGRIAYSTDGITWTDVANLPAGYRFQRGIVYGGGMFVVAAEGGQLFYSTDGVTWRVGAQSTWSTRIFSIAYGNGMFVSSGWESIAYSTNGITWSRVMLNKFNNIMLWRIIYAGGRFVGIHQGREIAYSVDGVTWTEVIDHNFNDIATTGIAYGAGRFVAVGSAGRWNNDGSRSSSFGKIAFSNIQE